MVSKGCLTLSICFLHLEEDLKEPVFPVTAHLFVFVFVFFVSIILMNLLVGLAVSDIQDLEKTAKLLDRIPNIF